MFSQIGLGSIKPYISDVVLLEVFYILRKQYKFSRSEVLSALEGIGMLRNIVIISKSDHARAMLIARESGIKIGDCYIATQIPKNVFLLTLDKEFEKLDFIDLISFEELLGKS